MNIVSPALPAETKIIVEPAGEPALNLTWGEYVAANSDDEDELRSIAAQLEDVGEAKGGGGAAPAYRVIRNDVFGRMQREMRQRARRSLGSVIRHGASRLQLRTLADIARRVDGFASNRVITTHGVLQRARTAYAGERERGRAGHWTYDLNRQIGLAEIVVELKRRIVAAGGLKVEEAA